MKKSKLDRESLNLAVWPSHNSFEDLSKHLFIPGIYALKDMEIAGFQIDQKRLSRMDEAYTAKLTELQNRVRSFPEVLAVEKRLGKQFNLASGDQLCDLLFEELELPTKGVALTKSHKRFSVDKNTIAALKDEHEIVGLLNQFKKYGTLYNTYIKPMYGHIGIDGRIHCTYQPLTTTGRLKCGNPNNQNIPKNIKAADIGFDFDPELNIKHLYVPFSSDYLILEADYSQMELRVLAMYCFDSVLIGIFKRGDDIHIAVGQKMADFVEPGIIVDKESVWRYRAKAINFGIIYGEGDKKLAHELKITEKEAKGFKENYFSNMPGIKVFLEEVERFVTANRYVSTMFGNHRRLQSVTSSDQWLRYEALRQAGNMPIQGTAGQYTICSVININDTFKKYHMKSKLVATVHDSILASAHKTEVKDVVEIMQSVMAAPKNPLIYWEDLVKDIPLVTEVKCSENSWADLALYI